MNKAKEGGIDYLFHAEASIGRVGYTHNIVTGGGDDGKCHGCPWCYAREMVEHGFLKGHPSYPYGFRGTFHPERVKAIGGEPKLIFVGNMGDIGGAWNCRDIDGITPSWTPQQRALAIVNFARLNPQHVILLLTKNPSWYGLAEWPENVYPGFTATNNHELIQRACQLGAAGIDPARHWVSLEPWLDSEAPYAGNGENNEGWLVIGGLTGPGGRIVQPVSQATMRWLEGPFDGKRFVKENAGWPGVLREYPEEWKVTSDE